MTRTMLQILSGLMLQDQTEVILQGTVLQPQTRGILVCLFKFFNFNIFFSQILFNLSIIFRKRILLISEINANLFYLFVIFIFFI